MSTIVKTACYTGNSSKIVEVESAYTRGFVGLQLIGNPSETCREGKDRAKAALEALNCKFPHKKILISLTPGEMKKNGGHLDLPIAISLAMLVNDLKPQVQVNRWLFAAEVGINGQLKPVKGSIPLALTAIREGLKGIVVANDNLREMFTLRQFNNKKMK